MNSIRVWNVLLEPGQVLSSELLPPAASHHRPQGCLRLWSPRQPGCLQAFYNILTNRYFSPMQPRYQYRLNAQGGLVFKETMPHKFLTNSKQSCSNEETGLCLLFSQVGICTRLSPPKHHGILEQTRQGWLPEGQAVSEA